MVSDTAEDKPEHAPAGKLILVYATFPSLEIAETVSAALVDARLVACVNIIPGMVSIYRWQGQRQRDAEVVMIIKTRATLQDRVISAIKAQHPYDIPAIVTVALAGGSAEYREWVLEQTAPLA